MNYYYLWHLKMFSDVFFQTRASSLSYLAIITNKIQGALHGNSKSQAYQYYLKKKKPLQTTKTSGPA